MPDIFDSIQPDPKTDKIDKISAPDIFDQIAPERPFKEKAIDFLTMGHMYGEQGPEQEISFTPGGEAKGMVYRDDKGKRIPMAHVPTGDPGFFQDPVTALVMGGVAGARAAAGPIGKLIRAGRESLGWMTGGVSDVPTLAKAGLKGIVKAVESKPLAKLLEKRQVKGVLESISPEARVSAEAIPETAGRIAPKAAPKVGTLDAPVEPPASEAGLPPVETTPVKAGEVSPVGEIVQPGATLGGKPIPKRTGEMYWPESDETAGLDILAKEQAAQAQRGAVGLDIGKRETKPTYKFDSPVTEKLFQSAKGIKPEGIGERIRAVATEIGNKFTRDFEHLANKKENAQLIFDLKRLEKQKDVVADRTVRSIGETISGLNRAEYDLFSRKVILDDLLSDYNRGLYIGDKDLPFRFTPESLSAEKGKLDALLSTNPKISEAIGKRQAMWDQVKTEYVEALSPYKSGIEDMFRENYYRHQVLDYVANNGIFGTGKRLRLPTNKGYTQERSGYSGLYNTDYLEAEHNIMAQMLHDAETAKTLTKIKAGEDIAKEIRAQAKTAGIEDWHKAIPEGYTAWQPKEGNVFHPVLTISEKTAEKIMAGEIERIVGAEAGDVFKRALAVGGKRKEWVVRQEVADTLNNLVRERTKGIISSVDLGVMTAWKKWQLISPRRYFKYNIRNLTGDAEATFLGNISGFKSVPKAVGELGEVFFEKKQMSPDMAAWFERGGMSSTLQAQEMDGLKQMWMFSRFHEKRGADLGLWNKYWTAARLTTDFRESVLRYANFLDYKAQLAKNGGKPLNYGASKPEMIDALPDINDKAFWLSNDLLGAYDRVSVAGQVVRERAIPFWSWQEVNFKRYIQLYKNAANNEELNATIGKNLGATTARAAAKVGSLAIKTAAFASMLAVYNNTFFKEDENQLPPDLRTRPHILLGKDEQGNIQYFNRMGTLDDFISWFGLDYAPRFVGYAV